MSMIVTGEPQSKVFIYSIGKNCVIQHIEKRITFGYQEIDALIEALETVKKQISDA